MEHNSPTKRIEYVDIAKGIGMLLVVWAHILVEGPINWFIYVFHMPLFFFISGMLFAPVKYSTCITLIKKRFHTLLVPYVIYSIVTWLVWMTYSRLFKLEVDSYWMPLFQTVIAQGSGGFLIHNVPLWFVTCLFVVEVAYFYINRIDKKTYRLGLCFLLSAIGYCMIEVFKFFPFTLLPWSVEVALATIIFYAVGNMYLDYIIDGMRRIHQKNGIVRLFIVLALAGVTLLCSLMTRHISYGSDRLGSHPIALYFGAFTGIALILLISNEISLLKAKSIIAKKIIDYIKWIGKYSFRIMAVHVPIKGFFSIIVAKLFHTTTKVVGGNVFYSGIVFLITLSLSSLITLLTNSFLRKARRKD